MPLTYFYGHESAKANVPLYQSLLSVLARKVKERLRNDTDTDASGVIIDTHAWSDMADLEILLHAAKAFEVDVILVTEERVYSALKPCLENSSVVVAKLPRSGGVVTQDAATRRRKRKARIDEYFYGKKVEPGNPTTLFPARINSRLSQYQFWQMGGLQMHEGIKVHGSSSTSDPLQLISVVPTRDNMLHSIVAVLHKSETSGEEISTTGGGDAEVVAGYLYIVEIDSDKDSVTFLAPSPGALPSKNIITGTIKWYE